MTPTSGIVKRLRDVCWIAPNVSEAKAEAVAKEAADRLEALEAENKRLRAVLDEIAAFDDKDIWLRGSAQRALQGGVV